MTADAPPADAGDVVWRRSAELAEVASDTGDRYALLLLEAASPVVLTGTAAAIWSAIDGETTVSQLVAELTRRYDAEADAVRRETLAFLRSLEEQGLIARMG